MARSTPKAPASLAAEVKTTKPATASAPKRIPRIPAPPAKLSSPAEDEDQTPQSGPEMKKQELIQKVLDRSDTKKKDVKPIVEAVLEILGEALAEGRELNLPPLGKLKTNRVKDTAAARIIIAKIRQGKTTQSKADKSDVEALAALAE